MKNNLLKWYMFAFLVLGDFIMFAQTAADNEAGEGPPTESDHDHDPDATPINSKLILLAIVGIAFAFHYYKKTQQQKLNA